MDRTYPRVKKYLTVALALTCGGVALVWPSWRTELQARSSYAPTPISALCEEATVAAEDPACHGLCVAAVQVCCDGKSFAEEQCLGDPRNRTACHRLTELLAQYQCGLEF